MNHNNIRAFAIVVVLPYLAGALLAGYAWHEYHVLFSAGRNKKGSDAAASAAVVTATNSVAVNNAMADLKAKFEDANKIHLDVIKARDAIDDGVNGRIECAKVMLATDNTPTPAEVATQIMLQDAQNAIGRPLTAKERAYWTDLALPLIKGQRDALNEAARQRQIAAKAIAARDAVQADSAQKDKIIQSQANQLTVQTGQLVASARQTENLTAKVKEWADQEPGLWARIKALCWLVAILGAVLVWYEIKRKGLGGALKDAVALCEHTKSLAVQGVNSMEEIDKRVDYWWENSPSRKLYETAKKDLRQ
jgi:hypothetical protein